MNPALTGAAEGDALGRSRSVAVLVGLLVLALAAAGGAIYIWQIRVTPEDAANRYLSAWGAANYGQMRGLAASPPSDFTDRHQERRDELGVTDARFAVGESQRDGDRARVGYTATLQLGGLGTWQYEGRLGLVRHDGEWRVDWSPAAMHPSLGDGEKLDRASVWPDRASIVSAGGERLDDGGASGSVQQLLGEVGPATEDDLDRLGAAYEEGDDVGHGGFQEAFEGMLAGQPGGVIRVVDENGEKVERLQRFGGQSGTLLQTTIDLDIQDAAADAVRDRPKPASLVAVQPSTGEVRAVANNRGGFNRALLGKYPPGSTFKVVTAAALLGDGLQADEQVECPATTTVNGRTYQNYEEHDLGSVPFHTAFAESCNTSFARLATGRLGGEQLRKTARTFGFGAPLTPGVPAVRGEFPLPESETELAAASFGQAQVAASPLGMATVAAAVADGTWRPPTLVRGDAARAAMSARDLPQAQPHQLDADAAGRLRTLMSSVVTEGTAADVDFPSGVAGKTGTAEFGSGEEPPSHAWFIAFDEDIAVAVLVEDGGVGGEVAAPIAADFLRAVG